MSAKRRDFLVGVSGLILGVVLKPEKAITKAESEIPELPWPYTKLNVEETRKLGHKYCYLFNCASATYKAIITQLREQVGYPYTMLPMDLYAYGGGGVNEWGTLCGSLNGAGGAITLIAGPKAQKELVDELMGWYTEYAFPSENSNKYAQEHSFLVDKYIYDELPQSVSGSPLCHVSSSKWCQVSGFASKSPERAERCARLSGDVAAKAVELLNAAEDKDFKAAYKPDEKTAACMSCHKMGENYKIGHFTIGKMNCLQCHESHF